MPKIILCDVNLNICSAWRDEFLYEINRGYVDIFSGPFQDLHRTYKNPLVMCTAGNSFGEMGGGIDLQIARYFPGVEQIIQNIIRTQEYGELLVGEVLSLNLYMCDLLNNKDNSITGLYYVPTMRVPMDISKTMNVYMATVAALKSYLKDALKSTVSLVMPGFGGSCGRVSPTSIAKQMHLAYDNIMKHHVVKNYSDIKINYPSQHMALTQAKLLEAIRG